MCERSIAVAAKPVVPALSPVQGGNLQRKCACGQHAMGGECEECKKKNAVLQRKSNGLSAPDAIPPIVHGVLRSPGQPLDAKTRAFFGAQFGYDFSKVRVHTDASTGQSAQAVHAQAYTVGRDIVFAPGRFAPKDDAGRSLLAHELTHVVQQSSAAAVDQPELDRRDSPQERQASSEQWVAATPLTVQKIQRAPEGEQFSLGSGKLDSVGRGLFGETAWPFLKAVFEGFVGGLITDVQSGRAEAAKGHLMKLLVPWNGLKFYGGYLVGLAIGIVSPITDLVKGIIGAVRLAIATIDWLNKWSPANIAASPERQQKILRLFEKFQNLAAEWQKSVDEFKSDPIGTTKKIAGFLDNLMQLALGKAREIGGKAAHAIFEFLEKEYYDMGKAIGEVIGALIAQVLLLVFSEAIGNLISKGASMLGKAAEFIAGKATEFFEWVKGLASEIVTLIRGAVKGALKMFEGLANKAIEAFDALKAIFTEVEELGVAGERVAAGVGRDVVGPKANVFESRMVKTTRETPTTVEQLSGRAKSGGPKGSKVDPYEKKVDEPFKKLKEVKAARSELANEMKQRLPKDAEVSTVSIERTEAGRAQSAAVTPEGSPVAMDVELKIKLKDGTVFKPDGVKFLNEKNYLFQEHKEVLAIWEKSHFSKPIARRELGLMLSQRAEIYLKLKESGCKGFMFTTNNETLADMLAEIIGSMKGPGRQGLIAPPL